MPTFMPGAPPRQQFVATLTHVELLELDPLQEAE
ncbi:hypothetical protein QFZ67_003647 [Streptomyces sp. V1I1]|nr:hypothetical protein [Streptomyces sp. V1I1]